MTNSADTLIVELIEYLAKAATRIGTSAEDRQKYIDQIAQLRISMNVPVVSTQEILDRR